jgi:hypothetical protein
VTSRRDQPRGPREGSAGVLDYFEQLAALERTGAFDLELIRLMVGSLLRERWQLWAPALRATHGEDAYPLFRDLAGRM